MDTPDFNKFVNLQRKLCKLGSIEQARVLLQLFEYGRGDGAPYGYLDELT